MNPVLLDEWSALLIMDKEKETTPERPKEKLGWFRLHKQGIIGAIIGIFAAVVGGLILGGIQDFIHLPRNVRELQEEVKTFTSHIDNTIGEQDRRIENYETNINDRLTNAENNLTNQLSNLEKQIDSLGKAIDRMQPVYDQLLLSGLSPVQNFAKTVTKSFDSRDPLPSGTESVIQMHSDKSIARHKVLKLQYTADELADQKILLSYKEGTEDVFFLGKFSENGRWDGNCLINIYENGNLKLIVDAEYEDGILLRSRQVFHYAMRKAGQQEVWAISNRTMSEDGSRSSGITDLYIWTEHYRQQFNTADVTAENMITAEDFEAEMDLTLFARYVGDTSDGYFNDDTGDAYMVYLNEDGTVQLLYVGMFKDGYFTDSTGNAWWIAEDDNADYGYYKGNFYESNVTNYSGYRYNISKEDVERIIAESGKTFDFELEWRGE